MKPLNDIVVNKFNTGHHDLIIHLPYVLEHKETKERWIVVLSAIDDEGLTFSRWMKTVNSSNHSFSITPDSMMEKYNLYKADLNDGIAIYIKDVDKFILPSGRELSEEDIQRIKDVMNNPPDDPIFLTNQQTIRDVFLNQNFNCVVTGTINEKNCPPTGTIVCHRVIDYKKGISEGLTIGIENFYKVDTESGVTVIEQFLYKVTLVKDADNDQVQYEIMLPVSESDKRDYMNAGWKIHPMFYNKDNDCYMDRVIIKEKHVMDFTHREEDSITIQILSGVQLLYLIEFGLNQTPNLSSSMDEGYIVISNAYADEKNQLVIDDEIQSILVYSDSGYISRFMYWNEQYDWLFLPKETTDNPTMTDSFFAGPTRNLKNIILWGDENLNAGIFRLWMCSTSTVGDEYIVPWEFGE